MSGEVISKMKVVIGADTKQFRKGTDDAAQATRQLKDDASSAFSGLSNLVGVNLGFLGDGLEKTKTVLKGLTSGFKSTEKGAGGFIGSLKALKVALMATGIGLIVVALGSLVAYFTKTERGADKLSEIMAGLKAVIRVLVDRFSALGEVVFRAFTNPKQAIIDLWEAVKTNLVNRLTGIIDVFRALGDGLKAIFTGNLSDLKTAAADAGASLAQVATGINASQFNNIKNGIKGVVSEMKEETAAAVALERARDALADSEIAFIRTEARLQKEIAKLRLEEKDQTKSTEERLAANRKANDLVLKIEAGRMNLQRQKIATLKTEMAAGENLESKRRDLAEAQAELDRIETNSLETQKALIKGYNTLSGEIEKTELEARKLKEIDAVVISPKLSIDWSGEDSKKQRDEIQQRILDALPTGKSDLEWANKLFVNNTNKLAAQIKPGLDEAKTVLLDFSETFNNTFSDLAVNFGEYIGELATGTKGFSDFGTVILSSLADLAINVGKIAIATGLATAGIKKALQSMNPYVAIAAGVALVALGSAVKGKLSAAASGASSSGTFSGNSYVYNNLTNQDAYENMMNAKVKAQKVEVTVTGEFKVRGSDLVSSINETNRRSKYRN